MRYTYLGNTGLQVSTLCLGTMTFGREADAEESGRLVRAALDAGINFFDTANLYSHGESERLTGAALKGVRDDIVLATKVCSPMGKGPNKRGLSRYHLMQECENSLRRLGTDHIDLYQTHLIDPHTPAEETLSALTDLVRQGKVRYLGCSNHPAWRVCEALWVSEVRHFEPYVSCQPRYNLLSREAELELLPFCQAHGLGVLAYSPLCGGVLTGKYQPGEALPEDSRPATNRNFSQFCSDDNLTTVQRLAEFARARDLTLPKLALAWVLSNPVVTSAIVGARTVEQLQQSLPAVDVELSEEDLTDIQEILGPVWIPPNTAMYR